jgi:hypothetical protein
VPGEAPVHPRVLFPAHPTSWVHFDKAARTVGKPDKEVWVVIDEQHRPLKRWHLEGSIGERSIGDPGTDGKSNEHVEGRGLYSRTVSTSIGARVSIQNR